MQKFYADLHIHSRFSRATSRKLDLATLSAWAAIKGVQVLGTGDITHPVWRDELKANLNFDEESGLYLLKDNFKFSDHLTHLKGNKLSHKPTYFMLQGEVSSIYKKDGVVRKVHNLIYFPDFESADLFCSKIATIANLEADGRPILGLDCHTLLKVLLEVDRRCVLIPAHIWTPWFSLFGSKSGFNAIEDCFGDLSHHIFALETGLSSTPEMNRLWSRLDKYVLVSNSDCHSPENIGREANIFVGIPSYDGIFEALRRSAHKMPNRNDCYFEGTIEFFPDEGKYFYDGHRDCGVCFSPIETKKHSNLCPNCGKQLTIGVLNRVLELSDRSEHIQNNAISQELVPLREIIAEILDCGIKTAKVRKFYANLLDAFGSELEILRFTNIDDLTNYHEKLGFAIDKMRKGEVICKQGYDGEYGKISLFEINEEQKVEPVKKKNKNKRRLDSKQLEIVKSYKFPVLSLSNAGSGKTQTLLSRIEYLLVKDVMPEEICVVCYNAYDKINISNELCKMLGSEAKLPVIASFYELFAKYTHGFKVLSSSESKIVFIRANEIYNSSDLVKHWERICHNRNELLKIDAEDCEVYNNYIEYKKAKKQIDYTDILEQILKDFEKGLKFGFKYIIIDEIQEFNKLQFEILKRMLPNGNGFLGLGNQKQQLENNDFDIKKEILACWEHTLFIELENNYRNNLNELLEKKQDKKLKDAFLFVTEDAEQEAHNLGLNILNLLNKTNLKLFKNINLDFEYCAKDFAILLRTEKLIPFYALQLKKLNIPFQILDKEQLDINEDSVKILAVKNAKALEFKFLLMPAMEEGLFPFLGEDYFFKNTKKEINESMLLNENKMFDIALSRCTKMIIMTYAKKRNLHSKDIFMQISSFIDNKQNMFEFFSPKSSKIEATKQLKLF